MPNIKKVDIIRKTIMGLQVRTKNEDEMAPDTQKIAPLWKRFYEEILPGLDTDAAVYGVYHHYESDESGFYDVTVGTDTMEMDSDVHAVTLQEGRYLMFPVKGELPHAIIETWKQVWAYFEDPSVDERRAYETDFELYKNGGEAELYIGVHYF